MSEILSIFHHIHHKDGKHEVHHCGRKHNRTDSKLNYEINIVIAGSIQLIEKSLKAHNSWSLKIGNSR